jgi:hypothetical protein
MDKATVARRVKALRALSVDPGATVSERARAKEKANELEAKYKIAEPPISYPRVTSTAPRQYDWEDHRANHSEAFGPTGRGKSYYAFTIWLPYEANDLDDIIEDGYGWADPEYYDE